MDKQRKEYPSSSNMQDKALANKYTHPLRITLLWEIVNGKREKNIHPQVTCMTLAGKYLPTEE